MKKYIYLLLSCSLFLSYAATAAQTARARLYSLSFAIRPATDEYLDNLSFNTLGTPASQDEIYPYPMPGVEMPLPGNILFIGSMILYDSYYGPVYGAWRGDMWFYLPSPDGVTLEDNNNNRYPDFFEVSRSMSATSFGSFSAGGAAGVSGAVTATWTRAAGSRTGNVTLRLDDNQFYYGTFHHTFEILEYTNVVSYTPGSNTVSGSVNLAKTGAATQTFKGPVAFVKTPGNRFNELTIQPSVWTNSVTGIWPLTNHIVSRDAAWPTNYAAEVEFDDDGEPGTMCPYGLWMLSIDDTNDADHDGIPDFSDDPAAVVSPPRRPSLSLTRTPTNLWLTVRGDTNHVHQVQSLLSLANTNWSNVASFNLTNDPQIVTLPLPSAPTFWRVYAQ